MRLTLLSKLFVSSVFAGSAAYIIHNHLPTTGATSTTGASVSTPASTTARHKIVVGVNDFGGAYPGVVANGGLLGTDPGSAFTRAGLDVEFRLVKGSKERLAAFDAGDLDVMLLSVDYLANLAPGYAAKGAPVKAFLMADWSRGNLGIVARSGFASVEALKGARIATTKDTPTHYFLLDVLRASNLGTADVDDARSRFLFAAKTPDAASMFERGEVDAAALWEPYLSQAVAGGKGRALVTTGTATNLVADVLFARSTFLTEHAADVVAFSRAWFSGVAALTGSQGTANRDAGIAVAAAAFHQTREETSAILSKIKPTGFADNRAFFAIGKKNRDDAPFATLFEDATRVWRVEKVITDGVPPGKAAFTDALEILAPEHEGEAVTEDFRFDRAPSDGGAAVPLLTKSVSVFFASGSAALDANAKGAVDAFAATLSEFGNAYVRVEGNTDANGDRNANVALSKRRADALVDYLVGKFGLDRRRFRSTGNGPDKPIADNATPGGRELNRRTDFELLRND